MAKVLTTNALDVVREAAESHHDTIYCDESYARKLKSGSTAPALSARDIDSLHFYGLEVVVLPISFPIVCQRGEVFPIARHWK